mmetsp:Transcript_12509/g.30182  ORF Transcript_12509/g.30182 Transcript_12509/m.30182 type:complete len:414 (+) Transcript_12509:1736-2977(+)
MTCCGPPKKCCTCSYTPPSQEDECRCGCGYHNGVFQVITAQFLVFIAFWFSLTVVGDCNFVTINEPIVVRQDGLTSDRLGLITYQLDDGTCYYYDTDIRLVDNSTVSGTKTIWGDQQLEYYVTEILGPNWYGSIAVAAAATIVAFLTFLYIVSYCCSAQVRGVRMFVGLFLSLIIVVLQGMSFLVMSSSWCADNGCTMGRSGVFAIAAATCFFVSGSFFCTMTNYPGATALARAKADYEAPIVAAGANGMDEEPREPEPDEEKPFPEDEAYDTMETQEGAEDISDDENEEQPAEGDGDAEEDEDPVMAEAEVVDEEPDLEAGEAEEAGGEEQPEQSGEVEQAEAEPEANPEPEEAPATETETEPAAESAEATAEPEPEAEAENQTAADTNEPAAENPVAVEDAPATHDETTTK